MRKLLISTLATLLIATGYATPSFADSIPDYPGISKLTRGVENSAVKKSTTSFNHTWLSNSSC